MPSVDFPTLNQLSRYYSDVERAEPENAKIALGAAAKAVTKTPIDAPVERVELRGDRVFLKVEGFGREVGLDSKASRAALYGACVPFASTGDGLVIIADTAARAAMLAAKRLD